MKRVPNLSRRALLTTIGATVGAASCGTGIEDKPLSQHFPLSVSTGDPTAEGALVWTRFTGTGTLELKVSTDGQPDRVVAITPADNGIVRYELEQLSASTWYRFVFIERDESGSELSRSEEGRFRTAMADDAMLPLRLGAGSCSNQRYALDTYVRAATEFQFDSFLLLGDSVYCDGAAPTLDGYRAKWSEGLSRLPNRLLRASTSVIATWDDHEIRNDAGDGVPVAQLDAARLAFFEHQPARQSKEKLGRIWRTVRFGRTAEVFVLDCRSERHNSRGEYVSPEQLEWLKKSLAESKAVFKIIMNTVPISEVKGAFFAAFSHDRWEGFPNQRNALLSFIDDTPINGVLWLTGDFHLAFIGRVALQGKGSKQLEIAVGPAGQAPNPSPSYPSPPQFDFATGINNFASLDFDPEQRTVRVRYYTGDSRRMLEDRTYTL